MPRTFTRMRIAVLADAHAHREAFDAVMEAAREAGVEQVWSLGDMVGRGPDPEYVVARTREECWVALMGNHDYGVTGGAELTRFGEPGTPGHDSIALACERVPHEDKQWMRQRKPAARRDGVQCWHGGPRNAVHEFVGNSNAAANLALQRASIGLVGHSHVAGAWQETDRGVRKQRIRVGEPLDIGTGKWLINPGAAGAPAPTRHPRGWWDALDEQAAEGAFWLLLDLDASTVTWLRAPYDPAPARTRASELGLDDEPRGLR